MLDKREEEWDRLDAMGIYTMDEINEIVSEIDPD